MNLSNQGNIIINNELEISPALDGLHIGYESLASDNSGRTLDGVMHIYWVYNRIRKIEIKLPPMTAARAASILSRVQGKIYNLTYWDLIENAQKTITVYTSNSAADCYSGYVRNGLYQGIQFNAIEIAGENDNYTAPITPEFVGNNLMMEVKRYTTTFSRASLPDEDADNYM